MKKMLKNRIFLVIMTTIIVASISVYAAKIYKATDVIYNAEDGSSQTVSETLNKLYNENINIGYCSTKIEPTLGNGMIPVTISDDGTVTYADINNNWFNYCEKRWANAVILSSGSYNVGDTIPEESIESYFVWIPRFRYKLWNTGTTTTNKKAHSIEIEFETNNTKTSNGSNNGKWLTHPAFTAFNSNGFWVGKFETGYNGATKVSAAQVNSSDSTKVIIKPNVYSWRYITVGNIFLTSYNYKRNLDSHMMKNTEWGAVAYLSHSKFGIDGEVNVNNNSSYKTGYSALLSTNQLTSSGGNGDGDKYNQSYNTEIGYLASTTGNITGVYDMSGGSHEYVAGYLSGKKGSSGFTPTDYDTKYFDVYSGTTYTSRILGDATGEMGPFNSSQNVWYGDSSTFISSGTWFNRGGMYSNGIKAGTFYFGNSSGAVANNTSFRIVLTP